MKALLSYIALFLVSVSCKWEKAPLNEVISKITVSSDSIFADGTSVVTIKAYINNDADPDKRTVNFSTNAGTFDDGKNGKVSIVAVYENEELVATTNLRAPTKPGLIEIISELAYSEIRDDYLQRTSIVALPSNVETLSLTSEDFSVASNFDGGVTIVGKLSSKRGSNVSEGVEVDFRDIFTDGGNPVNGSFKPAKRVKSGSESKVIVDYSPGFISENKSISILATVVGRPEVGDTLVFYVRNVK